MDIGMGSLLFLPLVPQESLAAISPQGQQPQCCVPARDANVTCPGTNLCGPGKWLPHDIQ